MARLLLFILLLAPAVAFAQPTAVEEEAAVRAAVHELWEAMRTGNADRARAVVHPDARGYSVFAREGEVMLQGEDSLDAFLTAIGEPHDDVWDERVSNEEVRVDGPFATYYAHYEFWLGERRSHCGVDAFQLVKAEAGWQIFVLSDTRRACA
jgi:hypothetical protein